MQNPIIVFGGNGFVGTAIAERLARRDIPVVCISRRGKIPGHLKASNAFWLNNVDWVKGDANNVPVSALSGASAVISTVGSPPVPTFSEAAFQAQVRANGDSNVNIIETAAEAGVKRLVLVNASIPRLLQRPGFGYYIGKQKALDAARSFALSSAERSAVVIRPAGIYGTRHTDAGTPIPLWLGMAPVAFLQRLLPDGIARHLPDTLISVDAVARAAELGAVESVDDSDGFRLVENDSLVKDYS